MAKKCIFCGKTSDTVKEREGNILLCEECHEARKSVMTTEEEQELGKEEKNVIELQQNANQQENDVKCEIVIGVKDDGSIYFHVGGKEVNLLLIEGLLEFGKNRLKTIWAQKDIELNRQLAELQNQQK